MRKSLIFSCVVAGAIWATTSGSMAFAPGNGFQTAGEAVANNAIDVKRSSRKARPPGWDRGRKAGWGRGKTPPGQRKGR